MDANTFRGRPVPDDVFTNLLGDRVGPPGHSVGVTPPVVLGLSTILVAPGVERSRAGRIVSWNPGRLLRQRWYRTPLAWSVLRPPPP